jgi:hypothetical protein
MCNFSNISVFRAVAALVEGEKSKESRYVQKVIADGGVSMNLKQEFVQRPVNFFGGEGGRGIKPVKLHFVFYTSSQ